MTGGPMAGESMKVGFGFDSHRFAPGRALVLGGVNIPFELGLEGHSDADALAHAVIDALLGATGRGNIGERFPDTDPAYRDADSCDLLARVWRELAAEGYTVGNLDAVVVAERPRIGPHVPAMRRRLAEILGIGVDRVNVKPKTAEGLAFAGQGEGVAAMVTVLLNRKPWLRPDRPCVSP